MIEFVRDFSTTLLYTLFETAPYVLLGYFIASLIREFLPNDFLARWLGPRGVVPLFKAIGVGSILPICSCGVVPLGVGLVRCGAARGTVLSFLATAPAISPVSLILGYSLLGGQFMLTYVVIVVVGAFILGLLGNWLLRERPGNGGEVKGYRTAQKDLLISNKQVSLPRRFIRACHWGVFDLGAEISLDLLFGLSLATLVSLLVPASWIASWLGGSGVVSILCVILLSLPVYTCSVPSLPVVQKLLFLGASPGVAVAYLIAGPATNLGELSVLRRSMGNRTMLFYGVSILLISLFGGLIANQLLQDEHGRTMIHFSAHQVGQQMVGAIDWSHFMKLLQQGEFFYGLSGIVVLMILAVGGFKKLRLLWVDTCKHCYFWNDVSQSVACPGRCWLKKYNVRVRRLFGY